MKEIVKKNQEVQNFLKVVARLEEQLEANIKQVTQLSKENASWSQFEVCC